MGITNFDMKNQAVQSRIAKALERIADALEEKTCKTSTMSHDEDSNFHPGHEKQTGIYDH